MAAPIKVTLLGGDNTGKTCYLVGMYGMMRKGTNGLTFAATDGYCERLLAAQWESMETSTGYRRWPPGTDSSRDYEFELSYGCQPICRFVLNDNRGGALHSPLNEFDVQQLFDRLVDSSCVFMCFSAAHLFDPCGRVAKDGAAAIELSEYGEDDVSRMNLLMSLVACKAQEKGRPRPAVAIVLTKYDLIAEWPLEAVLDKVRMLFAPLYAKGGGWTVTTCPVSLGKQLAGNNDSGKIEPLNVPLPLLFAFNCSVRK